MTNIQDLIKKNTKRRPARPIDQCRLSEALNGMVEHLSSCTHDECGVDMNIQLYLSLLDERPDAFQIFLEVLPKLVPMSTEYPDLDVFAWKDMHNRLQPNIPFPIFYAMMDGCIMDMVKTAMRNADEMRMLFEALVGGRAKVIDLRGGEPQKSGKEQKQAPPFFI